MIKPITTSPFIRRAAVGAMMAGAVAVGANAANKNNNSASEQPMYTELSSTASSAVAAAAMPQLSKVNGDENYDYVSGIVSRLSKADGVYNAVVAKMKRNNSADVKMQQKIEEFSAQLRVLNQGRYKLISDILKVDDVKNFNSKQYKHQSGNDLIAEFDFAMAMLFRNHDGVYNDYLKSCDLFIEQNGIDYRTPRGKAALIRHKQSYIDFMLFGTMMGKSGLMSEFPKYSRDVYSGLFKE